MARFVDAFSKATGRPHRVPAHFIDHEVLGADLTLSPPENAQLEQAPPNENWTIAQLNDYATTHDIDLGGAKKHGDILAAIRNPNRTTETPAARGEE